MRLFFIVFILGYLYKHCITPHSTLPICFFQPGAHVSSQTKTENRNDVTTVEAKDNEDMAPRHHPLKDFRTGADDDVTNYRALSEEGFMPISQYLPISN